MKKSNKLISFLLTCLMIICSVSCLTGCGGSSGNTGSGNDDSYRIILNVEGETTTYLVRKGNKFIEPKKPTKTDYVFEGWYLEETFDNKYDFDTIPDKNMTLYARFVLEYETINFNEQKTFSLKDSNSTTKLEYAHITDKNTTLSITGTGNLSVSIINKSTNSSVFTTSSSEGVIESELELTLNTTYRMTISGAVSSVLLSETVEKEIETVLVSKTNTLEFTEGVYTRKLYAHLSGEYDFTFNYNTGVNVTITDMEDNAVTGNWILRVYSIDLVANNWYKVTIEYNGTEEITNIIEYKNQNGETVYDTFGKVTPLADEEDDVYKTIIRPTIGSNIMLLSGSSTITTINIYDGERNLVKTLENESQNANGIYTESISLEEMKVEKDFYYVEMKFDKYSYYKNVYYLTKPAESEITSLSKNTSVEVEASETSMSWYKFQASEEDKYTLSSGYSAFIFDSEFKYQKMSSSTTIQLNANDIIYIGIMNTSTSNSSLIIKDSFAASGTMREGTYTRTIAYNDVYGILDTVTRKHRWTFASANTTLTIMDEDKNVLTSYTSSGSNDKFTYEITAQIKYYVRLKSSVGGNYTYEKAIDVNSCGFTDYSDVHIINSDNWKTTTTNLIFTGYNDLYKFNIPESGTYRFYAANTNARDFSKWYDEDYNCENIYILDEDNFKSVRIIAEYDSTTKQETYIDVELKKGSITLFKTDNYKEAIWFVKVS